MADVEHGEDESIRKANKDRGDGMNVDSGFVFGDVKRNKGVLNNPPIGLSKSFAEKMKKGVEDRELQMKFMLNSVSTQSNGTKRIFISMEDIKKGSEPYALQLYGYFMGTSMDYRVVNVNLSRMWRAYGIIDMTKTSAGLFYFKFNNKKGMKAVSEKPNTIPIWVCVYGIPLELCNGNGIGIIMSGVGKPMLMDKLTRERCLKKSGKLDVARVLVEVSTSDALPHVLEIEVRPRTQEETAAKILKDALNVNDSVSKKVRGENIDNDGFVEIGKKNGPVGRHNIFKQNGYQNRSNNNFIQSRGSQNSNRFNVNNGKINFSSRGPAQQDRSGSGEFNIQSNGVKGKGSDRSDIVHKPPLVSKFNAKFQLKVLVRGSGSSEFMDVKSENVPVKNSFQALEDHDMVDKEECFLKSVDEEFKTVVWSKLKSEVVEVMNYGTEPYLEDDDVDFENDDMAVEMKSGMGSDGVLEIVNIGADSKDGVNES
ncbi:hypothetical protein Tco_1047244 [Tanacetum coccineum]